MIFAAAGSRYVPANRQYNRCASNIKQGQLAGIEIYHAKSPDNSPTRPKYKAMKDWDGSVSSVFDRFNYCRLAGISGS